MARIKIVLNAIHCFETEDLTGADNFYLVAAMARESTGEVKSKKRGIWQLNNGQSIEQEDILFNEEVTPGENVSFRIRCFDQDPGGEEIAAGNLDDAAIAAKEAAAKINALRALQNKEAMAEVTLVVFLVDMFFTALFKLISLDKDDLLGKDEIDWLVTEVRNSPIGPIEFPYPYDVPFLRVCRCLNGCNYLVLYTTTFTQ